MSPPVSVAPPKLDDHRTRPASGVDPIEIAVIIPCYNEAAAIGDVVRGLSDALPTAQIYVYDNDSSDDTARIAGEAGAIVRLHRQRGKGSVVRRMFADVEADVYLMTDGDQTYDAESAPKLVQTLVDQHLDMVVGARRSGDEVRAYPHGHRLGNAALTGVVALLFGAGFSDMLSGYRAFSRRFVKSFPAASDGFEIETELTIHALELNLPFSEVDTPYGERPENSESKLRTIRDGLRILMTIVNLFKELRPFQFFFTLCVLFSVASWIMAYPIVVEFMETGLVPRFPTAILATGTQLVGVCFLVCGLVLTSVSRLRLQTKRIAYLAARPLPR